ncbi:MAG TPA: indole-3-glycerol-phosphate synthase [Methanocella sp.]|nr:indole-3-glycerol-phosphate synthase [Methanocella sp.]
MNFADILRARRENFVPFKGRVAHERKPLSLIDAIREARRDGRSPVIAEIKPASPTAGRLRRVDDAGALALEFKNNGACGISVLTEPRFFGGSLGDLRRAECGIPLLRKDFLFHPSQMMESYAYGADGVLLIASFFNVRGLAALIGGARSLGMEPLVEVHNKADIERAEEAGARLYAINNRDKDTLKIDLSRTRRLAPLIGGVKVSASGIETREQLADALKYCDAALIGGVLMKAPDPGEALRSLVHGGP